MAGRAQICVTCGWRAWRPAKAPCIQCGGKTQAEPLVPKPGPMPCAVCATVFTPANRRIKSCSPECSLELDRKSARESARRKYERERAGQPAQARPRWSWLKTNEDAGLSRTILRTLDEQSAAGTWPWPDVLTASDIVVGF